MPGGCPTRTSSGSERRPVTLIEPSDESALRDAIAEAVAARCTLAIEGGGTKRGLGRPVVADRQLSLARLAGITYYEPHELVLEAGAGTPLAEIEAALAAEGQQLAFEPPDLGPLYGAPPGRGTLGGAVACNLSGPRRPYAGAARDHVLGIRAVSGRGEAFASGGRVVKNVTGYDMSKLMAGSFGTLAALSRATVKVLPRPEAVRTALFPGADAARVAAVFGRAADGPWDVSAAAFVPGAAAARSGVDTVAASDGVVALRLEGSRAGVIARVRAVRDSLAAGGATEELHTARSQVFWAEVASGALLPDAGAGGDMIWRLSLPPSRGPAAAARIGEILGGEAVLDWSGGLVWFALPGPGSLEAALGQARRLRSLVEEHEGHATLMRAPEAWREDVPVFQPEAPALARLTRRVKENFDPLGVLNPGRMFEGL